MYASTTTSSSTTTEEAAAKAYDKAAARLRGERAKLNFPSADYSAFVDATKGPTRRTWSSGCCAHLTAAGREDGQVRLLDYLYW